MHPRAIKVSRTPSHDDELASVEAIERVARLHAASIHRYLRRRVGSDGANDLLGEVWVRALASRATYDPERAEILAWLYGIARNVLRAHWRRLGRATLPLEAAVSDPWPDIDDLLDLETRRTELARALLTLSDDEREVLLLVAWEELTQAAIAELLGVPAGTVRSRLHRARAVMRGELGDAATTDHLEIGREH